MKVPLSWLKEFLPLTLSPDEIARSLTLLGIEVEAIEKTALSFSGVVVGKVLQSIPHPNAERLQIATVFDGTEEFQVVCGAPNCRAGLITPFARIDALLTDKEGKSWKIKRSKIRDIESQGMLCAAEELHLNELSEGILELDETFTLGTDFASLYQDTIFDISLTPNLGHALSIWGIARELAAFLETKAHPPSFSFSETGKKNPLEVVVENKELCPRYTARTIRNVKIGPSPEWIAKKLKNCGLKPINNVVDICNLVMLELGQPLHAFDADKIVGHKITVTDQVKKETFLGLDEKTYPLPSGALLICDEEKPLALAGILGDLSSSTTLQTKNIVLESACFSPSSIRKTSKQLGLKTDASYRFERGIDPNLAPFALDRAAALIQMVAEGEIAPGNLDTAEKPFLPKHITCRLKKVRSLLGIHLSLSEAVSLLERLEMRVSIKEEETLYVQIPTYRTDLHIESDLIEEIGRLFGYNNIPRKTPCYQSSTLPHTPLYILEKQVEKHLLQANLQQVVTCDLISPTQAFQTKEQGMPESSLISVLHPSSVDQSVLRPSLLPGLLEVACRNFNHQTKNLSAFEIGKIHFKEKDQIKEQLALAILLSGLNSPWHWDKKPQEVDFYDLKGILENLLLSLNADKPLFKISHLHTLHPGRQAEICLGSQTLGFLGEVHPHLCLELGIKERLFFAELSLPPLIPCLKKETKVKDLIPFPGTHRDWTLSLEPQTPVQVVLDAVKACPSKFLESCALIDLFIKNEGHKNITLRFSYRDSQKNIVQESVDKEHARLLQLIQQKVAGNLSFQ